MDYCKRCGDTGYTTNGKHCRCKEGELKRVLEASRAKARERAKEAVRNARKELDKQAKETAPAVANKPKYKPVIGYQPGEWVVIDLPDSDVDGVLCEVLSVDVANNRVWLASKKFKGKKHITPKNLKPAPIDLDDRRRDALRDMFINMAIDTEDHAWLKELGGVRNE